MEQNMITIFCENNNCECEYPLGTTLYEIAKDLEIELSSPICGAFINNRLKGLDHQLVKPKTIRFISFDDQEGKKMYLRSLSFLLYVATCECFPEASLKIDYAIANGYYCEIHNLGHPFTVNDLEIIKAKMKELIGQDKKFHRLRLATSEAVKRFEQEGLLQKADLFRNYGRLYAPVDELDGYINFFYGHMVPSTSYLEHFGLDQYYEGLLLQLPEHLKAYPEAPNKTNYQNKLFEVFKEHKKWARILNAGDISSLNTQTRNDKHSLLIKVAEALHEKKISEIANQIYSKRDNVRIVLIAGPSSSGKTTFSKRLAVQLAVCGLNPIQISLDDYFVERDDTPKDENGEFNFEALEAIDIKLFNNHLNALLSGETITPPKFDFGLGKKIFKGHTLTLGEKDILIIEGIHGMNPDLIPNIAPWRTFKIFVSALTPISIDEHNYIKTTDNRLIRRIIRDYKFRKYSATETISRWPSVRKGEEHYIFPFQENADVMFNSASIYELAVLKKELEPKLKRVKENQKEYNEATRLLNFISYFESIPEDEIPPTSILREFLGGSSFGY